MSIHQILFECLEKKRLLCVTGVFQRVALSRGGHVWFHRE